MTDAEQSDRDGPMGTFGCACVCRDAKDCATTRYGYRESHDGAPMMQEPCACLCHDWQREDDE